MLSIGLWVFVFVLVLGLIALVRKFPKIRYVALGTVTLVVIALFLPLPWDHVFPHKTVNGFREQRSFPSSMNSTISNMSTGFYNSPTFKGASIQGNSIQFSADGRAFIAQPDYVTWVKDSDGTMQINWFFKVKTIGTASTPYAPAAQYVPVILDTSVMGLVKKYPQYLTNYAIGFAFENKSNSTLSFIISNPGLNWFIGTKLIGSGLNIDSGAVESWIQGT